MRYSAARQAFHEVRSILVGYPAFVFQLRPRPDPASIPVFVHHSIQPDVFEEELRLLAENGIDTLSLPEFLDVLDSDRPPARPSVLLTVDDGRSSFWRYGFPLLEKYGAKATLFVIPGRTHDATTLRPNLADAWRDGTPVEEIQRLDAEDESLCSWLELDHMHRSGRVAVESHSLFHREVFVGGRILDFVGPATPLTPYNSPITPYLTRKDVGEPLLAEAYHGLPLYRAAPLLAGQPALQPDPELMEFCRDFYRGLDPVRAHAGDWKRRLRACLAGSRLSRRSLRFQRPAEVLKAIRDDLALARDLIQDRLGADCAGTVCAPYTAGSDLAVQAARDLGLRGFFWGVRAGRRINRPADDPFYLVRLKHDFVYRLPVGGRRSLLSIYGAKLRRRLQGAPVH